MGFKPQNVPRPPGLIKQNHTKPSDDSQEKRRISGATDTRRSPIERSLYAAEMDASTVASSGQNVEDFHPLTTPTENLLPLAAIPFTPWLTIREGERYAHVGDGVLRAAVKRGDVPAYRRKGGKGVLVHMTDLDAWIRSWDLAKGVFA